MEIRKARLWTNFRNKLKKSFVFAGLPVSQPSFLTAHQKQDPATAVSIPVSASTHFRAISDTGPSTLAICVHQPGETAACGVNSDPKEIQNGARVGPTTMTGDRAGEVQGIFVDLLSLSLSCSNPVGSFWEILSFANITYWWFRWTSFYWLPINQHYCSIWEVNLVAGEHIILAGNSTVRS